MTKRLASLLLAAGLVLAACGSSAGPSAAVNTFTPTAVPGASAPSAVPGPGGGGTGGGGDSGSGSGSGGGTGIAPDPGTGVVPPDPATGAPALVVPHPGQVDPRPVNVQEIAATADGRRVTVRIAWWSGVEPCHVLDSVTVAERGFTITLTALEGSGGGQVACIEIAQYKATLVDLGELAPGTWTIAATGDARPVTVEIR